MHPQITSLQNPKVKQALALEKSRERKKRGQFLVEGLREFQYALQAGYASESVFYDPGQIEEAAVLHMVSDAQLLIPLSPAVFGKLAYRENTAAVVAVMKSRSHQLTDLKLPENPLVLVVESVEKPGNLGALLRTADAANVDAVVVCDPLVDFYNPNVIRASVGTVFTRNPVAASGETTLAWLREHNIAIYATHLEAAIPYTDVDFTKPSAIVMGTEATGLSALWSDQSTANIIIPMRGAIDSMNVSAAAAVVVFEAVRQRFA